MNKELHFGFGLDLEGPLVNLEVGHHTGHLRAAEKVGLHLTLEEALRDLPHFIGGPDEAVAEDIHERSDKSLSAEDILKETKHLFAEWLEEVVVIPTREGLFEKLEEMKSKRIPHAIGSATDEEMVMFYVKKAGLEEYFDKNRIITASDKVRNKPRPDIYLKTAEVMEINPSDQIVVEDSPRGAKAGVAARSLVVGLPVIYVDQTIQMLKNAGAQIVYREWTEMDLDELIARKFLFQNHSTSPSV